MGRLRRAGYDGDDRPTPASSPDASPVTGPRPPDDGSGTSCCAYSDRPTAIFAANDLSAVGVLAAADELGLRVPEDLSVVGYDNTVFARLHRLSLTTIDGHIAEVGQVAGRTLTARIDGDSGTAGTRLLSPRLVVRSSTGRPAVSLTSPRTSVILDRSKLCLAS